MADFSSFTSSPIPTPTRKGKKKILPHPCFALTLT
uniref:Uncharacterized protein n=1 Tax=Rhizophora mucronata TaxID=61149 RepID=A0A2P2NQH1_RHIMU